MALIKGDFLMKASFFVTCVAAAFILVGCNTDEVNIQSFESEEQTDVVVTPEQTFLASMVGLWAFDLGSNRKEALILTKDMVLGTQMIACRTTACDSFGTSVPVVKTFDVIEHSANDVNSIGTLKAIIDGVDVSISRIHTDGGMVLKLESTDELGEVTTQRYESYVHQFRDTADQHDRDLMSDIVGVWSSGALVNPHTNELTEVQYEITAQGLWDQNRYLCSEVECYQRTFNSSLDLRWSPQSTRVVEGYVVYDLLSYRVHPQLNVPYNIVYDRHSMTVDHSGSDSVLYMWNRKTDKPRLNQPLTKIPH